MIVNYCKDFEEEFQRLERSVGYLITEFDHRIGSDLPQVSAFNLETPDHIKFAYTQVKILFRNLYCRTYRDVRRNLGNIIRFLFKNMDDEDHVNNVAFVA